MTKLKPTSVKGVVIRDGAILLLLNERDQWELPGGKLETGEPAEACVVREIAEECSLAVEVVAPLGEWIYEEIVPRQDVRIVTFGCRELSRSIAKVSNEHRELRWFPLEDLTDINLPEGYRMSILEWADVLDAR